MLFGEKANYFSTSKMLLQRSEKSSYQKEKHHAWLQVVCVQFCF